ncbi:hypothetical protein HDU86_000700 [Geranomyces michiganensis]|nr:hypothetical protein HDU86_000700 [Geranomyces michiganensis]
MLGVQERPERITRPTASCDFDRLQLVLEGSDRHREACATVAALRTTGRVVHRPAKPRPEMSSFIDALTMSNAVSGL